MTPEQIQIRAMRSTDLEQVSAIDRLAFSMPWPQKTYEHELNENPAASLWVAEACAAEAGCMVVGLIVVWLILDEAHIATIAVHPDFRRQGIGSQLLGHALQEAKRSGALHAMLEVRASNAGAQEMYRRFGFEVVYRRPRYYKDNFEDALLMNLNNLADSDYSLKR